MLTMAKPNCITWFSRIVVLHEKKENDSNKKNKAKY